MTRELERHHRKETLLLWGSGLLIIAVGFLLAWQFVEPAPPKHIRIATGSSGNAYYQFGSEYSRALAAQGITLEVVSTAGSVENLALLSGGEVDVAFVQGGITPPPDKQLQALASLYFEPLWLFYRDEIAVSQLSDLGERRLAVGREGSGTRPVALQLLADNGIGGQNSSLLPLTGSEAADGLRNGSVDALFMVTSPRSPQVRELLETPGISLFSFHRADGYRRIHRYLSDVSLPAGVIDMEHNIPARPITLLAPAATLVVRNDFHPALATLLLQAATDSHGNGGLFEQPDQFPSGQFVDYPLNEDAERFLKSGPPFLQRYLPFWAANLVDRLIVMLVPLITLMIPLAKILPPTYRWRIRSRIYRWYDQLRSLDFRTEMSSDPAHTRQLLEELTEIEKDVMQVAVPKSYADTQYNLRLHIRLIRERLERKLMQTTTTGNRTDRRV